MKAPVNKIIPFSSVDGPGNRTAIFLQGCSFDCKYCHNPETIRLCVHCGRCAEICPTGALSMVEGRVEYDHERCRQCDACIRACPNLSSPRIRMMSAEEVLVQVRRNMPFIRGITISGGECTLHRDFLLDLARLAVDEGLHVLLDSNGSYDFSEDEALAGAVDGVMLDVKAFDEVEHIALTGVSNRTVLKNLSYLAQRGKLEEVRTVVIPEMMNAEETVRGVCDALIGAGAFETRYKLIRFRAAGVRSEYRNLRSPTDEEMNALSGLARDLGIQNTVLI